MEDFNFWHEKIAALKTEEWVNPDNMYNCFTVSLDGHTPESAKIFLMITFGTGGGLNIKHGELRTVWQPDMNVNQVLTKLFPLN